MKYAHGKNLIPVEMTRDYVARNVVHEIIERDGKYEYKRILPSMIKKVILDGKLTEAYMATVTNQETYGVLKKAIDNENKYQERRRKCMIPDGRGGLKRCDKSCKDCNRIRTSSVISLEAYTEDTACRKYSYDSSLKTDSPEIRIMNEELKSVIHKYIDELPETDGVIVKMIMNGCKECYIAEELGMTQANVNIRKKKIFKKFKIFLQEYL